MGNPRRGHAPAAAQRSRPGQEGPLIEAPTLSVDRVVPYLLGRGLLDSADIVDGDVSATDVSRRNRNLRVSSGRGRSYLIKQADAGEPGSAATLRTEAAFCRLCQEEPGLAVMRGLMPRLVEDGSENGVLVFELLERAEPLWQYYRSFAPPSFPVEVGPALGRALGQFHAVFRRPALLEDPRLQAWRRSVPWVLGIHQPGPAMLERLSPANLRLLKVVQGEPGVPGHLDSARDDWRFETVVHGDIKSDNVLVRTAAGPGAELRVCLVDWEMVQLGDPAWDVAAAFADFVGFWILSLPPALSGTVEERVAGAPCPLSAIQPALRGLWREYRVGAGITAEQATPFLVKAVRFSAVRLIQSAYERSCLATDLPSSALSLLQVAANILADPEGALWDLLGIPLPEAPPGRR